MEQNKDKKNSKFNTDFNFNSEEELSSYSIEEAEVCGVPERTDNKIEKADPSTYAFNWQAENAPENNREAEKRRLPLFYSLIMAISFITVFSIFVFSPYFSAERVPEPNENITPSETEAATTDSQKTIYIKEYDPSSGMLTPHEIYSNSSASVVTIKTSNGTLEGIGSGFVFEECGYIATAEHVIHGMSEIYVITSEGEKYAAELICADALCDLALLKIEEDKLPPLEFGKSADLLVGDRLYAIGTPAALDFAGSMTGGELSYLDRKVSIYNEEDGSLKKRMTLLQTSAALNPGNSGGPVFDSYGKVVGIVTMKLGNSFDGISFAIPSDGAKNILLDMKNGVELDDTRRAEVATYAAKLGVVGESYLEGGQLGVKVLDFSQSGCDAAKKLKVGDVIVSLNTEPVSDVSSLSAALANHDPLEEVFVTVWRQSQFLTFSIILTR